MLYIQSNDNDTQCRSITIARPRYEKGESENVCERGTRGGLQADLFSPMPRAYIVIFVKVESTRLAILCISCEGGTPVRGLGNLVDR